MEAKSGITLLFISKGLCRTVSAASSSHFALHVIPELKPFQCDLQLDIYWKVKL